MTISGAELAQLITAIATAIGVLFGIFLSWRNGRKIHRVQLEVNSRLSQLLEKTRTEAFMAGREHERDLPPR